MNVHKGALIKSVLKQLKVSITELSRILEEKPGTVNKWLSKEEIDAPIIDAIGKALTIDLISEYPELKGNSETTTKTLSRAADFTTPDNNKIYWMNKYIDLMEKFNHLLAQQSR